MLEALSPLGADAPGVIASGGVGTVDHVTELDALAVDGSRLAGVIMGRALYEGAFTLTDALSAVGPLGPDDGVSSGGRRLPGAPETCVPHHSHHQHRLPGAAHAHAHCVPQV